MLRLAVSFEYCDFALFAQRSAASKKYGSLQISTLHETNPLSIYVQKILIQYDTAGYTPLTTFLFISSAARGIVDILLLSPISPALSSSAAERFVTPKVSNATSSLNKCPVLDF